MEGCESCELDLTAVSRHSLTSSVDSFVDRFKLHLAIVKWTGALVLLSLTITTVSVVSRMHTCPVNYDCIRISSPPISEFNSTLCTYVDQYELPEHYYVSVCRYDGKVRIDIRQFLNDQGVTLSLAQYDYLQRLQSHIRRSIHNAG